MPLDATPRDLPIPSLPTAAAPEQALTPETVAKMVAALRRLLWLMMQVTVLRLLGFRFRPQPRARAPRPCHTLGPAPVPVPVPAAPRQKYRYIDTAKFLAVFARINAEMAQARVGREQTPPAAALLMSIRHRQIPPARGPVCARTVSLPAPHSSPRRRMPRPHPPPLQNRTWRTAITHAYFVTI